ncbi:MAG: bifunctional riboflavin kinase/FAD synthetase [Chloroflexi bacterium]|nr:bifunctional riboflavin kinase/FAD synthetase [Chloroflexota bacterium]
MQNFASLQDVNIHNASLAIGAFDGVHLGHQQIINELTAGDQASPAVVFSFHPHPALVIHGSRDNFYLTSSEEKSAILKDTGIDILITQAFNQELAEISAHDFMQKLRAHLGMQHLFAGHDFALGKNREGDVPMLSTLGETLGYVVHKVPPVLLEGEVISSSRIRRLLLEGNVELANQMLGRTYNLTGEVESGRGRGTTIGIPTANLKNNSVKVVPGFGVYVCRVYVDDQTYDAVTNIGVRPTFETEPVTPSIETHLLDFDADIYGREIKLEFIARLREELRFSNADELVAQMQIDFAQAREKLAEKVFNEGAAS